AVLRHQLAYDQLQVGLHADLHVVSLHKTLRPFHDAGFRIAKVVLHLGLGLRLCLGLALPLRLLPGSLFQHALGFAHLLPPPLPPPRHSPHLPPPPPPPLIPVFFVFFFFPPLPQPLFSPPPTLFPPSCTRPYLIALCFLAWVWPLLPSNPPPPSFLVPACNAI